MSHRSTRLRIPAILLAAVTGLALPAAAHAEGQAGGKPLPPPASDAMPPVELTVEMRGKAITATVTDMPFVPHRYFRKKS